MMAVGGRKDPSFVRSLEHGNDFLFDFTCSPCDADGKNKEAIKFCLDCGEYLCGNCLNNHNRFAKMKSHHLVDPSKQQNDINHTTIKASSIAICCEKHQGKTLDMFCGDHDEVCCAVCIALEHSLCKSRHYIPEIANGFKKSAEFKEQEADGQNILSNLECVIQKKQADIDFHKTQKDAIYGHFKQVRENILKQFNELEKRSVDFVERRFQQNVAKVTEDMKKTEMVYKTLKMNEDKLKTETDDPQAFALAKSTRMFKASAKETVEEMCANKVLSFDFRINEDVRNCLASFKSLGHFYTAARCEIFSVQDKDEKNRCAITGFCQLPNGDLVVVDASNHSAKRLGSSYIVKDKCRLPSQPWSVCICSDTEIAVSLCNEKKIQFLSVKREMKLSSSFRVEDTCTGLACLKDIYVGFYNKTHIQIYSYFGMPKTSIDFAYGVPWHITVSMDSSSLYVASREDGVFSVDLKTLKSVKMDIPGLKSASSLALTRRGTLLVSCMQSNRIYQYTNIGCKTLLTKSDGVNTPQTIFYDQEQRLFVASENTDMIRVYPELDL